MWFNKTVFLSFYSLDIVNTFYNDIVKSFLSMVTSFRVRFTELKIKRWYCSLCLLRKRNKIMSEWWHFLISHLSCCVISLLLCALMYYDNCAWNQGIGFCVCVLFLPPLSRYCFSRDTSLKLINQITKCVDILWLYILI